MTVVLLAVLAAAGNARTPAFEWSVERVTAAQLRYSWHRGCPVAPSQLRRVRVGYWGFDGAPHTGRLVVNARVVGDVVTVFRRLYATRFPLRRVRPIDVYRASDERSLAADNTAGFNCRYAIAPGRRRWSVHAYGEAIDVNPVENPYLEGGRVHPRAGRAYLDRTKIRRGMAVRGGVLVRSFATVGWQWGGRWSGSPDYQHFSATGG
jgi:D-alanyl-D-alanine carboxypeptidase